MLLLRLFIILTAINNLAFYTTCETEDSGFLSIFPKTITSIFIGQKVTMTGKCYKSLILTMAKEED